MFWKLMVILAAGAIVGVSMAIASPQHTDTARAIAFAAGFGALALIFGRATLYRYRGNLTAFTNHALIWAIIVAIIAIVGWTIL